MKTIFSTSVGKATSAVAVAAMLTMGMVGCARSSDSATPSAGANDPGITDTTITLGIDTPLSGVAGGPGSCGLGGLQSYFEAANADGGIKFGDGQTRKVTIKSYDDAYDPAKAVSNFRQMVADNIFADVGSLGTPNNLAIMPVANQKKVPQVFLIAGTPAFSNNQKANPWTIGWYPTYKSEGEAFGEFLAEANKPITVASLAQNDDVGEAYVAGLKEGIKGSQVKIVAEATYNVTDPSVDAQITTLAATKADVFFSADSQTPLAASSLLKAQQLGWLPTIFLASGANSKTTVIGPGHGEAYPAIYSTAFSKSPQDPQYANDPDVKAFLKDMNTYAPQLVAAMVPHCVWGYQIGATLDEAFKAMKAPTRAAFMDAIHGIKDLAVPMMLPGITVDATSRTQAPISVLQVQKFANGSYAKATSYGD